MVPVPFVVRQSSHMTRKGEGNLPDHDTPAHCLQLADRTAPALFPSSLWSVRPQCAPNTQTCGRAGQARPLRAGAGIATGVWKPQPVCHSRIPRSKPNRAHAVAQRLTRDRFAMQTHPLRRSRRTAPCRTHKTYMHDVHVRTTIMAGPALPPPPGAASSEGPSSLTPCPDA